MPQKFITTSDLILKAKRELKLVAPNPYQESLWILESVCINSSLNLQTSKLNSKQQQKFWDKIYKRKQGWPLQYILKQAFFFKQKFFIKPGVFIPRPETELLINWMIKNMSKTKALKALDFGAGAGTLCLPLLSYFSKSRFIALEIAKSSISCLSKNSLNFKLNNRLKILQKDVEKTQTKDVIGFLKSSPSLIVANPPYLDNKDKSISPQVYGFEPPLALFSDKQGMGHIIAWFKKAIQLLSPKGIYIFEFGWNQKPAVEAFLKKQKQISRYEIHKDQLNQPRMALIFKK